MNQPDQNQINVAGANNDDQKENPPPPIFKLNANCLEHIFDKLPLADILAMGETCVRMNQMAGYYLRENLPKLKYELISKNVFVS